MASLQVFTFSVNWKVPLPNDSYASQIQDPLWSYRALNVSLAVHFNASVAFPLLVLENLKKHHNGDYVGHVCTV